MWKRVADSVRTWPSFSPLVLPRALQRISTRTRLSSSSRYSSTLTRYHSQALKKSRQPSAMPASPVLLPGAGPPVMTHSISGCAHSTEPNFPRSHSAEIERTRSKFVDIGPSVADLRVLGHDWHMLGLGR